MDLFRCKSIWTNFGFPFLAKDNFCCRRTNIHCQTTGEKRQNILSFFWNTLLWSEAILSPAWLVNKGTKSKHTVFIVYYYAMFIKKNFVTLLLTRYIICMQTQFVTCLKTPISLLLCWTTEQSSTVKVMWLSRGSIYVIKISRYVYLKRSWYDLQKS